MVGEVHRHAEPVVLVAGVMEPVRTGSLRFGLLGGSGASARNDSAPWAPVRVPLDCLLERNIELRRKRRQPRGDVTQLVKLLFTGSFTHGASQFTELLGEPRDRGINPPLPVALPVGAHHQILKLSDVHPRSQAR